MRIRAWSLKSAWGFNNLFTQYWSHTSITNSALSSGGMLSHLGMPPQGSARGAFQVIDAVSECAGINNHLQTTSAWNLYANEWQVVTRSYALTVYYLSSSSLRKQALMATVFITECEYIACQTRPNRSKARKSSPSSGSFPHAYNHQDSGKSQARSSTIWAITADFPGSALVGRWSHKLEPHTKLSSPGLGTAAEQVKSPFGILVFWLRFPVAVPSTFPLIIHLLGKMSGKQQMISPCHPCGKPGWISWLLASALGAAGTQGVSQQIDLSLSITMHGKKKLLQYAM